MNFWKRNFNYLVFLFSLIIIILAWFNSGTISPYASTLNNPYILDNQGNIIFNNDSINDPNTLIDCYYLGNYDHKHYLANHNLAQLKPKESWQHGWVLRRISYYVFALPLTKSLGFLWGGFIFNVITYLFALILLVYYLKFRFSYQEAFFTLCFFTFYPGFYYWAGLPYAQNMIMPNLFIILIIFLEWESYINKKKIIVGSIIISILLMGYDMNSYIIPASIILLARKKTWKWILPAISIMLIPSIIFSFALNHFAGPLSSENSGLYLTIIKAWLDFNIYDFVNNLIPSFKILLSNFSYSQFLFYPILLLLSIGFIIHTRTFLLKRTEIALLIPLLAIFFFNNWAPQYPGWQMRGEWISRLYQAFIIPSFLILFRNYRELRLVSSKLITYSFILIFISGMFFNFQLISSGILNNSKYYFIYENFYIHSPTGTMEKNLRKHGNRPLGMCSEILKSQAGHQY